MNQHSTMRFAVRPAVVAKLLAQLLGLLAVLSVVPALVAAANANWAVASRHAVVIVVLMVIFASARLIPAPDRVQRNEAMAVVALLFLSASLLAAYPIMGYGHSFVDAWFEATSGVTTTGLSTLALDDAPAAFLFGRGWLQWVGGIGVVVLALALLSQPGGAARKLGFSKAEMGDHVGGTRAHAKRVILIYLALTVVGTAALWGVGADALDALVHCMTAVSTGGFANHSDSLGSVGSAQLVVINLLCVAGAISFHVYYLSIFTLQRGKRLDSQLYALLLAIGLATAVVWVAARADGQSLDFLDLLTLIVSAQTTAGFASLELGTLPAWLLAYLCAAMLIGGGLGSTAGGIKLGRLLVVLRSARLFLARISMPDSVHASRTSDPGMVDEVLTIIALYLMVLAVSWFVFLFHGLPPLDSLFEVTSALATAGLSVGVTSQELPALLKSVLCFDMLFGRVEGVALFVALAPRTWIGRRRSLRRPA